MHIEIDIKDNLIDKWGTLIIAPVAYDIENSVILTPGFEYRVEEGKPTIQINVGNKAVNGVAVKKDSLLDVDNFCLYCQKPFAEERFERHLENSPDCYIKEIMNHGQPEDMLICNYCGKEVQRKSYMDHYNSEECQRSDDLDMGGYTECKYCQQMIPNTHYSNHIARHENNVPAEEGKKDAK